ncbi:urea transporter [Isosphaeraceae bacterium EP7]
MQIMSDSVIPGPIRPVFRGIGQVFFQENALSGLCFVIGIAIGSPLMAIGAVVGSALGLLTAKLLKFDEAEIAAGIYGFNSALVGIATFFFFKQGPASIAMLVVGSVAAAALTHLMRKHVPFPTYTTPFILITWAIYFLGLRTGVAPVAPGAAISATFAEAVLHGVGQVMFQASIATGVLFLLGIALGSTKHAAWVVVGAIVGTLVGSYHATVTARAIDPERLVERALLENIALGLYGYNATLAAVALSLWRRSLIPPLLGILLSVPLTEVVPLLGLPALTAPFVLATWIVLALGWFEGRLLGPHTTSAPVSPGSMDRRRPERRKSSRRR